MTDQFTKDLARIRELLPQATKGEWHRMDYGKKTLPYNIATTDGRYNNIQCVIATGEPTGGNGWPAHITTAEKIANAELICLLKNNIEAILELLATAYAEGQQSTMKIVSEQSKKMVERMHQGREPLSYQDRVRLEKQELDDKIGRLKAFVGLEKFATIPAEERERLYQQLETMCVYSCILSDRIAAFNIPPPAAAPAAAANPATATESASAPTILSVGQQT